MNIPTKRLPNGFEMPVYGYGLWQVGGRAEADFSLDAQEIDSLQSAIAAGVTHFDTAESYAAGHAEELLGAAIRDFDRRKLLIASKVSAHNQRPDDLRRACEASLHRLGTDYLDLYLLHRFPEVGTPIAEVMAELDRLVEEGLIRHIGVSNFSVNRMEAAKRHTANPIVCNQVHYNVKIREPESSGVMQYCVDNDILVVAWRPMQKGNLPDSELIKEIARSYSKTPNQVMINWLISQPNVVTIAKTSKREHLNENLGAVGWALSAVDIERIRTEFPDQQAVSDAVPLNYAGDTTP